MNNKKLRLNIYVSVIAKGLSMLISLAYTSLILNYLGNDLYGLWSIVLNVISMIHYFDVGIGNGIRNKVAESETRGDHNESSKYVATGYVATAVISVIFCSLLILIWNVTPVAAFFNLDVEGVNTNLVVTISLIFLLFNFVISISKTITYAVQKAGLVSIAGVICQIAQLVAVLVLWLAADADIVLVSIIYGSVSLVESIVLAIYIRVKYPYLTFKPKNVNKNYLRPLMTLGILFFTMQISSLILNTTDNLLISRLFSVSDVTPYNVSYKVFFLFVQVHAIAMSPMWSAFTEAKERKDFTWIRKALRKTNLLSLVLALGAFVLIFVFKPLAHIWLHKDLDYSHLIVLMAIYVIFSMFANNYVSLLCGVGEIKFASIFALVQAGLNIPFSILLAKYTSLGVNGIIMGSIIVMFMGLVAFPINYHIWMKKMIRLYPPQHLPIDEKQEYDQLQMKLLSGDSPNNPNCSICVPFIKDEDLFIKSLQSAVNQKYESLYEVIVLVNKPSKKLLNDIKELSNNIVCYESDKKYNFYEAINALTHLSKSNYIIPLHEGEELLDDSLTNILSMVKNNFYGSILTVNSCHHKNKPSLYRVDVQTYFHNMNIYDRVVLYSKDYFYGCGGFYVNSPIPELRFLITASKIEFLFKTDTELFNELTVDNQNAHMEDVIVSYHQLRRKIFEQDKNVSALFKKAELEYLNNAIDDIEKLTGVTVDKDDIYQRLNIERKSSSIKMHLLKAYKAMVSLESSFQKKSIRV